MLNDFQNLLEFIFDSWQNFLGTLALIVAFRLNIERIVTSITTNLRTFFSWIYFVITGRR